MGTVLYPAGGWLPPHAHLELKWDDQGRDFATDWRGIVQAPGAGECINIGHDQPFPNGFGPHYPIVRIDTGLFAGHQFYVGHCTTRVAAGEHFSFGQPLAVANQGRNWAGTHGGWVELGEAFGGIPGPKSGRKWFDGMLEHPLAVTVPDPPLQFGDLGARVLDLTERLRDCGYLTRRWWRFNARVHGAVVAFKAKHLIHMPPVVEHGAQPDRGIVDAHTDHLLTQRAQWCRQHHQKEV